MRLDGGSHKSNALESVRLTDLIRDLPTALLVIDGSGAISYANRRAGELLHRTPAVLREKMIDEVFAPLDRLSTSQEQLPTTDLRRKCIVSLPNGSDSPFGFNVHQIGDTEHRAVIFQDLSPLDQLRKERDRLLQLAAVGETLPTLLHELKNPLAGIATAVELLIEDSLQTAVREQLHSILSEIRRMKLAFDGVGAVGRCLRTQAYAPIDLACRQAIDVMTARARAAQLVLRSQVLDMPLLPLDPAVIRAILFNLLVNAIHACTRGDTIRVNVGLSSCRQFVELHVTDTGSGMTFEVYQRCTELFYSTKRSGSGIGLALCSRAVRDAQGTIEIRSVIDVGTNVSIRIPIDPTPHWEPVTTTVSIPMGEKRTDDVSNR